MVVVALCETLNRYRFFQRFHPVLKAQGGECVIFSYRLSVVLAAKRDGLRSVLVAGAGECPLTLLSQIDLYEEKKGLLTMTEVQRIVGQVNDFLERTLDSIAPDYFFIWNGSSIIARACSAFLDRTKIKKLYFEIGNFPGKTFVDPEGVNIRSWFARNYLDLDRSGLDMESFSEWKKAYLDSKKQVHQVQQASTSVNFNWSYPLDLFGFLFLSAPCAEKPEVFKRTINFVRSKLVKYQFDDFEPIHSSHYLFFPMQVSTDSQILWNSDVDNMEALSIAVEMAQRNGLKLVIKPHPAEVDRLSVVKFAEMRKQLDFLFVNGNTFTLLENCESVVTINSTVGIEAMLCGKKVHTLGLAMYKHFSPGDLAFFLQSYLIDVDFFSSNPLAAKDVDTILSRADINSMDYR